MRPFFLDTADPNFVENARVKLRGVAGPLSFRGVTTNPKAIAGICKTQNSARRVVTELAQRISEFRGDNEGELFLQLPGSKSSFEDMVRFIEYTYNWGRPYVKLGYKLPHFRVAEVSSRLSDWSSLLNVTGVTDCWTAVECMKSPVRYVSLLTGRMEERGIDARYHLAAIRNAVRYSSVYYAEIITGSMRTTEQLDYCWAYRTVPTIGRALWEDLCEKEAWRMFQSSVPEPVSIVDPSRIAADSAERQLSQEFFDEMDGWSKDSADKFVWG